MSNISIFQDPQAFEHGQRVAKALASSDIVPKQYQGNVANTLVALNMSNRIGADPMIVMQNLNIIHGRPSWSSSFLISSINTSGRFGSLRYKKENLGMINHQGKQIENLACTAYAKDLDGETLEGSRITIQMAIAEGWYTKSGSKWPNMPEQMLMYRAASFFSRAYCPEITMGMKTTEEYEDMGTETVDGVAEVVDMGTITERVMASAQGAKTETVRGSAGAVNIKTETVSGKTEAVVDNGTETVQNDTEAGEAVDEWL